MKRARKGTLSGLSRRVVCKGSTSSILPSMRTARASGELELVDDLKIASTWIEPFDTEQGALEAALAAVEEDADRAYVSEFFGYRLQ